MYALVLDDWVYTLYTRDIKLPETMNLQLNLRRCIFASIDVALLYQVPEYDRSLIAHNLNVFFHLSPFVLIGYYDAAWVPTAHEDCWNSLRLRIVNFIK